MSSVERDADSFNAPVYHAPPLVCRQCGGKLKVVAYVSDEISVAAVLGAVLIMLAEVLRQPIEKADDPRQAADRMIDLSVRWLRRLLEPVTGKG